MASPFRIVEHKVPCQYIREYPRALAGEQEDTLYLAVKQYIPLENPTPQRNDVTIISSHANSFPKELYEPLFEDLLAGANNLNFRIRGIWIADVANQGASGVLNEDLLGNDPSLSDFARDILHLVNLKRDEMPRPIIGLGHSMGGNHLVDAALIHPRLFTSLILLDPVIQIKFSEYRGKINLRPVQFAIYRPNSWPSREAAAAEFKKHPFYKAWDPRVMELWCKHGVREVPVSSNDNTSPHPETEFILTTPPSQEAFVFVRENFDGAGVDGKPVNRKTHPDLDPRWPHIHPFYFPGCNSTFERLPQVRPSVLYVFPTQSNISSREQNEKKLAATGVGVGGSGGVPAGRVKGINLEGHGHLFPMEAVKQTADVVSEWIDQELAIWRKDEEAFRKMWTLKSKAEKQTVDERWKRIVGGPPRKPPKKLPGSKI